jgi:DNA-binding CsgD family transcriptional regulator
VLARNRFTDVHDDFVWLGTLTMCTTAASLTGDRRRTAWLYDLLAPHEGRNVLVGLAALDRPVGHALGLAARTLGRDAAALEHFERASAAARELGALPWEAHALYEMGVTLRAMGRDLDAREPLRRAAHLAGRFGGSWLLDQAGAELRAAGARPRRTALDGAESLTSGELRVARLAASGFSNAEIADTLVLTRRTVETHLTHVYRKLGATRADLAGRLNGKPR